VGKRISQRDKVRPAEDCFEIKEFVLKLVSLIVRLYFPLGGEKTFRDCLRDCLRDSENEIVPKLFAGFSKKYGDLRWCLCFAVSFTFVTSKNE